MTRRRRSKRPPARRRPARRELLANPPPAPATMGAADGMYVKLPIPPELAAGVAEWIDRGVQLAGLFVQAHGAAASFVDELERAADRVRADVDGLTRRRPRRSPR